MRDPSEEAAEGSGETADPGPADPRTLAALDGAEEPAAEFVRGGRPHDGGEDPRFPVDDGVRTLTRHILEQLRVADAALTSPELAGNRYRAAVVRWQCSELVAAGLVEPAGDDAFRITEAGIEFLSDDP